MLEEHPIGHLRPTYVDLAQQIEGGQLAGTRLGEDYFVTMDELRRWQLEWLCARLRERYPSNRPDREAS